MKFKDCLVYSALSAVPLLLPVTAEADLNETLDQLLSEGKASVSLRYRIEDVSQDNALQDASAATLRTRLSYQSAEVRNFAFVLEADNVMTLGADHYDSFQLNRYRGTHSVIADPEGTEINQVQVRYSPGEGSSFTLGRQRINHDTQRFIGGVGWRQNEQTYDAASYRFANDRLSIDYSYLWNVNRIFKGSDDSAQLTDFDSDSHLLLAAWQHELGTFSAFVYALDFENSPAASSVSTGISYKGKFGPVGIYAAYASQSEYADNPVDYQADYTIVEASLPVAAVTFGAGFELLGSDDGLRGFATPLATLHKFQGFTDLFLNTPADGVEDLYLTAATSFSKLRLSLGYHQLQAAETSADYGDEWQLIANWPVTTQVGLELKYASYESDGFAVDTDKFWFSLNMAF